MAISSDFSIDYVNKRVYHSSGTTVYTVNQLYTYLMDMFDEVAQMDDDVPMSAQTPTEYTMINSWFIDQASTHFLKGGAIKTIGYAGAIQEIALNTGHTLDATDIGKQLKDDTVEIGVILAVEGNEVYVRSTTTVVNASAIAVTGSAHTGTANVSSKSGEDLYANIYTLGTVTDNPAPALYVQQGENYEGNVLTSWWLRGHIDVLIKVKSSGTTFNDGYVRVFGRQSGDTYDYFQINLSAGGRNAVPLATATDLNQLTDDYYLLFDAQTGAFTTGLILTGVTSGATAEVSSITDWGTEGVLGLRNIVGTFQDNETVNDTSTGSATTNGTRGSGFITYDTQTANFTIGATLKGATIGTIGQIVGMQDDGASGKLLIYASGSTPAVLDNEVLSDTNGTPGAALASSDSLTATCGIPNVKVWFMNHRQDYDGGGSMFIEGDVITGLISGATGTVVLPGAAAASGNMYLANRNSTWFLDNEVIIGSKSGNIVFYASETSPFTVGKVLTSASGATGTITSIVDNGTTGIIFLKNVSGTFLASELITDTTTPTAGSATTNGTSGTMYLAYDTETVGFTTLGQVLTGTTSTATGTICAIQDNGATGILLLNGGNGKLFQVETITGASEGSASATGVQTIAGAVTNGTGFPSSKITRAFEQQATKNYKVVIDCGGNPLTKVYQYLKYVCRENSSQQMFRIEDTPFTQVLRDDGGVFTDYTIAMNDIGATQGDVYPLTAAPAVEDALYLGNSVKTFARVEFYMRTAGVGTWTITWEYWNGSTWSALNPTDNTIGFTSGSGGISKDVYWNIPTDWTTTTVQSTVGYWVRARVSSFTSITTQPTADRGHSYALQQICYGNVYSDAHYTYTPVKAAPFGTFAGGKLFAARGIWVQGVTYSDIQNYQLVDADGVTQTPPNYQAVTVSNLISGDRVSVFRTTGSNNIVDKSMYMSHATSNDTATTTFTTSAAISVDTPSSGYIRLRKTATGVEERIAYSAWSGTAFTLSSAHAGGYGASDTAYIPFIDESVITAAKSVSVIYTTSRNVVVRVRRYTPTAILPFETTGTFGSTGYSVSAIRTADTIVG